MPTAMKPRITCVIATFNRSEYLRTLLPSLFQAIHQAKSLATFEVRIFINGLDHETDSLLSAFDNEITVIRQNQRVSPAEARNRAFKHCKGEWIAFLDDDLIIPDKYFVEFLKLQNENPTADVFGGPNLTPDRSNNAAKFVGFCLSNPLISGPMAARYTTSVFFKFIKSSFKMTLCNLFVKRSCFEKHLFNSDYITAEENDFIYRIEATGAKFCFSPSLMVYHFRRKELSEFIKQINGYGVGRGQFIRKHPAQLAWPALITVIALSTIIKHPAVSSYIAINWLLANFLLSHKHTKSFNTALERLLFPIQLICKYGQGIVTGLFVQSTVLSQQTQRLDA